MVLGVAVEDVGLGLGVLDLAVQRPAFRIELSVE